MQLDFQHQKQHCTPQRMPETHQDIFFDDTEHGPAGPITRIAASGRSLASIHDGSRTASVERWVETFVENRESHFVCYFYVSAVRVVRSSASLPTT